MQKKDHRELIESKILSFCKNEYKSLGEIAEHMGMNKHTLRAHYLYPLRKEGKLASPKNASRSGTKYIKR